MKLLQLKIAAFGLLMLIAFRGYGQQGIKISGTLTDSLTHVPIPFATVVLLSQQAKAPVKAAQTDTSGHFMLEHVPVGAFILRISFVGHNSIIKDNILIDAATGDLNLGALMMTASKNNLLKEVVVAGKKEALQNADGKKVF
ncbi:MAG: carboxypeptidase-like regulatory domain-containing protein, partial [Sphingobacteriales bacterium]